MLTTLAMSLPSSGPSVDFYHQWSQYLSPQPHIFLTMVMLLMHSIALIFYYLAQGVLTGYQNSFKLLDFLNIFFSPKNEVYQSWNLGLIIRNFMYLGIVALGIMMLIQWLKFIVTDGRKGREWPKGVSITMGIITAMPLVVSLFSGLGAAAAQDMMGTPESNVITRLWEGNSTNLKILAQSDFNLGSYRSSKESKINDQKVTGSDYHSVMSDQGYTSGLNDNQKQVFTKKIGGDGKVVDINGGSFVLGKTFADEYPVMKTNWLGIIAGEIIFIFVVVAAIFRLFTAIYKMAFMSGSIVYFGLRDGTQGKRAQEILSMIEGQVTGIILMPVSLIFFFAWIQFAFNTINNLNLEVWPFTVLSIAALLAGAKGLFTGFDMVEQWTGVRTGSNPVATMMLANQASHLLGGVAKGAKQNLGKGLNAISPAQSKKNRELGDKIANKNDLAPAGMPSSSQIDENSPTTTGKVAGAAAGLGRFAGAAKNPGQLLKSTGKAGLDATKSNIDQVVDGVKDYAGGIKDNFEGGKQAVDAFNKRHGRIDPNQSMPGENRDLMQRAQSVEEALAKARQTTTNNENGSNNASKDVSGSQGINTPNINKKMQSARQNVSEKPYDILRRQTPYQSPSTTQSPRSSNVPDTSEVTNGDSSAGSQLSDSGRKTSQAPIATNDQIKPHKSWSEMTPDEREASDKEFAERTIQQQLAKHEAEKNSKK
ncbi:pLS20_p028 family conjugation system transmembrane protein [Leuconostoc pseudomesenteroides]|uniref:pLS20_p028 family conjugation system transmembrane protein n=1 Tax=Leuconostoc pseudomesenteroides TaxID=33968 RepID=UPI0032DE9361